jgi:hypothetical protein
LIKSAFIRATNDVGCDIMDMLIGCGAAEIQMQLLIEHCSDILTGS